MTYREGQLLHAETHTSCEYYAAGESAPMSIHALQSSGYIGFETRKETILLFVLEGTIRLDFLRHPALIVKAGEAVLVPARSLYRGDALEACRLLTCTIDSEMTFCNKFSLKTLTAYTECRDLPPTPSLTTLTLNSLLAGMLEITYKTLETGLLCIHYQHIKREEIFFYLRAFYPPKKLAAFFRPILCSDYDFKSRVREAYHQACNAKELAAQLNMSLTSFNRKFMQAFGEPAGHWIIKQKKENILRDIMADEMTISELAEKYGFTPNYFIRFCKDHFGQPPAELKKNHKPQ